MKFQRNTCVFATLILLVALASGIVALAASPVAGDAEIKACIVNGLGKSEKLKEQKVEIAVSSGVATITGMAKNGGSKGAITRLAKKCGATDVKNNASIENPPQRKK